MRRPDTGRLPEAHRRQCLHGDGIHIRQLPGRLSMASERAAMSGVYARTERCNSSRQVSEMWHGVLSTFVQDYVDALLEA